MRDRRVVVGLRGAVAAGAVLTVVGCGAWIGLGGLGLWWSEFGPFVAMFTLFFAAFVWVVVARQPRNPVVWTMAACATFGGAHFAGNALAMVAGGEPAMVLTEAVVPVELPEHVAWILMFSSPTVLLAFFPLATIGLLLFPDGRLPGARWRSVMVLSVAGIVLTTVGWGWGLRPWSTVPADRNALVDVGFAVLLPAMVLSLAGLVVRYRRSRGPTRDRFKWIVWGAALFVPSLVLSTALGGTAYEAWIEIPLLLAGAAFLGAYGIAVGKYRLFDVDLVISRTVVVGGLAVFITAVYAVVVGGVGLLLGSRAEADVPLSIAATVLVAIAFQPARERMHRWANRLVYGQRATPYEVLSRFSTRMRNAVATDELIPQMAQMVASGTGAEEATVWLRAAGQLRPIASWPDRDPPSPVPYRGGRPAIPGVDHLSTVEHDGDLLGAVTVSLPRNETMSATEQRLIGDVASQAGLILRNAGLTADLIDTVEQLRTSRQRLVAAQDEERRRLERDLHDGAQQQFIAVKLKAAMARRLAEQALGEDARATELIGQLVSDVDEGVRALRDLAHGIYPPLLEAEGLPAALSARAARAPVDTSVRADLSGRYPRETEAAIYFCVLEAIQNTVKYADADTITIELDESDGRLTVTVTDDGRGFDPDMQRSGRGLSNMTDRIDALGGDLDIASATGQGTTVTATVPVPSEGRTGDASSADRRRRVEHAIADEQPREAE